MALIQVNYLDWTLLDAKRQYEILVSHEIPVWVMEPLKGGRLATLNQRAADILKAAAPERSLSSWGFRFLMGLDHVILEFRAPVAGTAVRSALQGLIFHF